jgi:hypothetical protein
MKGFMVPKTTSPSPSRRGFLWLGVAFAVVGIPLYFVQLMALGRTDSPWYAPVMASLGVVMVFLALLRRASLGRWLVLSLMVALMAGEWWFLLRYVRLPAYNGPVSSGQPFPKFRAMRADGSNFANTNLIGDRTTALVFFRGHW